MIHTSLSVVIDDHNSATDMVDCLCEAMGLDESLRSTNWKLVGTRDGESGVFSSKLRRFIPIGRLSRPLAMG